MSILEHNYNQVIQRLQHACMDHQRNSDEVKLLAVSKTKPASMVQTLYDLGQRSFGENYLQDGEAKITELSHLADIEWHFIGPLQSNKTRSVAENFQWLETLDREKIARRLHDQRPEGMAPLNVLIQVNISAEGQKSGIAANQVMAFAEMLMPLSNLQLRGLMCIPEATDDETKLRSQFEQMKTLFDELKAQYSEYKLIDTLSMGMSADMSLAIACGATEIRIGTDIFGAR
ncbi:MAG: YggS family pyridoxal phosphate-dependent enzyme [Oleibacter sp.]|nr:YggS family pyridoxal phosphate-dependent enzyme [Thalassolituus sp.]